MNLQAQLNRQRVKHIVDSYQLEGEQSQAFWLYLEELLQSHPSPLVELAMIETLVTGWLTMPLERGTDFLAKVHHQLQVWQTEPIASSLTPEQFQQITGLDAAPIFGLPELPPPQSSARPF